MSLRTLAAAALASLLMLTAGGVSADDSLPADDPHKIGYGYHDHVFGVFVGGASEEIGRRENGFVLGFEYEYRFGPNLGIGAIIERTYGDLEIDVYALPIAYHNGPWKLYVAPGIEDGAGGSETMFRVGVEHGFHVGKWEISPQVDIDFVERETDVLVIGVVFARGFNW